MKGYKNYPTEKFNHLKQLYLAAAEKFGNKTLVREKVNGAWQEYSFHRYAADVDALGTQLLAKGCAGKNIMITGENSYAWVTAYMAVACGVGTVVPIDKDLSSGEMADIISVCEPALIIGSSAALERFSEVGVGIDRLCFGDLADWIKAGNDRIIAGDRAYLEAEIDADAMSMLIFTSGTSGISKGVMLSHKNICFNLSEMCQMIYFGEEDHFLSVLPLHHVYECVCGFLCPLYRGATVSFSEGLRYFTRNLREVQPTVMLGVPMLIETMYRSVWKTIRKQGMEKKVLSTVKMTNALPMEKMRVAAKRKAFARIHENFGSKLRLMISVGAPIDPAVLSGLRDFGIKAYQGYGLTECAPLAALNRDAFFNDASAGMASPNALLDIYDVQNDGTGEIRYKGENVMLGYYKMPELTAKVLRGGWFYTGDLGYLDENGFLFITGRKKNAIAVAGGKSIFPEELEELLSKTPYVKEAVVVGYPNEKKKDYDVVALIYPDYQKVKETYGEGFTAEQLDLELKKALADVNSAVKPYKRIATYVLRNEEFPKNFSRRIKRAGIAESAHEAYLEKINH